jgi:hypothetical protein
MVIHIVIVGVVIGILLWLIQAYVPMEATLKRIVIGVGIIGYVLWAIVTSGILHYHA